MEIRSDCSKKCISCLSEPPLMHDLKDMFDDTLNIAGLFKLCLNYEINKPYFPKMVCEHCLSLLKSFFNFKMKFLKNEKFWINYFLEDKDKHQVDCEIHNQFKDKNYIKANVINKGDEETESEEEIILQVIDENDEIKEERDTNNFKNSGVSETSKSLSLTEMNKGIEEMSDRDSLSEADSLENDGVQISMKQTKFKCSVCKTYFIDSTSLNVHLLKHQNHKCDICKQVFIKKRYLTDHKVTHKIIRDVLCPICSKAFKSRHTMRVHMKIHTNPGSHMCENCGCSFNQRGTLKTHIRLKHSDNRDYLCLWCGLNFKLKSTLDKHTIRKHSLRKTRTTFKCSECNREYLNKSNLDKHFRMKHSASHELVACELCHKLFSDRSNLLRHKRSKHIKELIELT